MGSWYNERLRIPKLQFNRLYIVYDIKKIRNYLYDIPKIGDCVSQQIIISENYKSTIENGVATPENK